MFNSIEQHERWLSEMHSNCVLWTNPFFAYHLFYSKNTVLYQGRWLLSCDECDSWLSCVGTTASVLRANQGEWALIPLMWIPVNVCMNINGRVVALKNQCLCFWWESEAAIIYRNFFLPGDSWETVNTLIKNQECVILDQMHYQM